jgi:hypothetical protein
MKTNKYYILLLALTFLFNVSCEDSNETFDTYKGGELLSFADSSFELSIPQEDLTLQIPVFASSLSSSSRTFNASVTSSTTDTPQEYSIGTITIPANEYEGSLAIDFDFSEISGDDGELKELVVSIDAPSYNNVATINYFREIVCNDLKLTIVSDVWASETYWTLEQADGTALVERFFPFGGNAVTPQTYELEFMLPDGDYVYKMGDSYGDGMVGTGGGVTLTGNYSLTCSILTHASGEGAFSPSVGDPFPGNPNATIEVTPFTVNP